MTGKVGFVSLGCPKALVDSEQILSQLSVAGYQTVSEYAEADLVVVNTCGFVNAAIEESIEAIEEALDGCGKVVVTGCLGAHKEDLERRFPSLLSVSGPQDPGPVLAAVQEYLPQTEPSTHYHLGPAGVKLTPPHYAYLKVSEGCNHTCSFCIIPSMRGKLRSRPIDDVLAEADGLAATGVQELLVIAQDTSAYGLDLRYESRRYQDRLLKSDLETLCVELGSRFPWLRLHYVYPYPHVDRLLPLMADGVLLPYLDVPLQHADPRILKAMRRPAAVENTLERLRVWRETCPEITIRSTFIVGFPGEGDREFKTLIDFLHTAQLDRVGCFAYSDVDGASANSLPGQVEESTKLERLAQLMAVQEEISASKLARRIGQDVEVIIDEVGANSAIARTRGDAPDVDGVVHMASQSGLTRGMRTWAHVVDADAHDLYAQHIGNPVKFD
ncbi:MAG: 30S ribosomal protein S12 methylthiotransferase RimO [Gammaproteobacteria bacterium]|nr:30S ribosomal protein S12 methylthiotransferase RimO [Gammaproteobacteria bacterium]